MYQSLLNLTECKLRLAKQDILQELAALCAQFEDPVQLK
jgi:hypothetical protein